MHTDWVLRGYSCGVPVPGRRVMGRDAECYKVRTRWSDIPGVAGSQTGGVGFKCVRVCACGVCVSVCLSPVCVCVCVCVCVWLTLSLSLTFLSLFSSLTLSLSLSLPLSLSLSLSLCLSLTLSFPRSAHGGSKMEQRSCYILFSCLSVCLSLQSLSCARTLFLLTRQLTHTHMIRMHALTHAYTSHSLTHSCTHSLSLSHSLTHSFTHSLNHSYSLAHSPFCSRPDHQGNHHPGRYHHHQQHRSHHHE